MTPAAIRRAEPVDASEIRHAVIARKAGQPWQAIAHQVAREVQQIREPACQVLAHEFICAADTFRSRVGKERARQLFVQLAEACE